MGTASPLCSPSALEQTFKKSLPDLLMSSCSVLFEPTLPGEHAKQTASRVNAESRRMEPPSIK
jgi:hypothetical protein